MLSFYTNLLLIFFIESTEMHNNHMHDRHFIKCCYGYHEHICGRLHIQKCLIGDCLQVYQFWCFYQKVHNTFGMPLHDILELVIFHTFSIAVVLNVDLNTKHVHVCKNHDFKMSYPMTYTCYPFETWRGYRIHPYLLML